MRIYNNVDEIRAYLDTLRKVDKSIGLVPTMGALHNGHLTLINEARKCDIVVVSIFVNPLQFNMVEDLDKYPRQLSQDIKMLESRCDVLFAPEISDMYQNKPQVSMDFMEMGSVLEGAFRPGHFNGVGVVVAKLFNIIQPEKAYFGLKDLQQYVLIKQMVTDLSMPVEIVGCPIAREESGLAMSSRNQRLSENGRAIASNIHTGLKMACQLPKKYSLIETKNQVLGFYKTVKGLEIEYLEFVDDLMSVQLEFTDNPNLAVCVAGYVEGVRLIDNLYLRSEN